MEELNLPRRLEDLKEQRQRLFDDINAVSGAIQFCEQLIQELEKELKPDEA
mgnify:CR=1 FL=1